MTRISSEEKRKEAANWLKGLIGIILILGALIIGYLIYKGTTDSLVIRETEQIPQQ